MTDYNSLVTEMSSEFPGFRIVRKPESRLMRAVDLFLKVVTLWRMTEFMTEFLTVVGTTVYVPGRWDSMPPVDRIVGLRHERIHMRQSKRYGALLFRILYVAVLPSVWTYRAKFEMEAYGETIRALVEYRGTKGLTAEFRERMIGQFTSSSYFWMKPFRKSVEKWYTGAVSAALKNVR